MINRWIITGDTHGQTDTRLKNIEQNCDIISKETTGVIILGDSGINYYLNKTDKKWKKVINNHGIYVYCVRGNHEERPENIPTMEKIFDENVNNFVWCEPDYAFIRYFIDGATYRLVQGEQTLNTLVAGGAYSVDKDWRLRQGAQWFPEEQLSLEEMSTIIHTYDDEYFDLILTHTCPYSWQPTDLFLGSINQESVDNSMELWMERLKNRIHWHVWLFGHYHDDRLVRPYVEMYYTDYEDLSNILERWKPGHELEWWLKKDPNFYIDTPREAED